MMSGQKTGTGNSDRAAESGSDRKHLAGHDVGQLVGATKTNRCTEWTKLASRLTAENTRAVATRPGEGVAKILGDLPFRDRAPGQFSFPQKNHFFSRSQ